jgi:hypothetical protein
MFWTQINGLFTGLVPAVRYNLAGSGPEKGPIHQGFPLPSGVENCFFWLFQWFLLFTNPNIFHQTQLHARLAGQLILP